jgi:hypothetical protein
MKCSACAVRTMAKALGECGESSTDGPSRVRCRGRAFGWARHRPPRPYGSPTIMRNYLHGIHRHVLPSPDDLAGHQGGLKTDEPVRARYARHWLGADGDGLTWAGTYSGSHYNPAVTLAGLDARLAYGEGRVPYWVAPARRGGRYSRLGWCVRHPRKTFRARPVAWVRGRGTRGRRRHVPCSRSRWRLVLLKRLLPADGTKGNSFSAWRSGSRCWRGRSASGGGFRAPFQPAVGVGRPGPATSAAAGGAASGPGGSTSSARWPAGAAAADGVQGPATAI